MGDLTLQDVALRIVAVALIAAMHGFVVAATACWLGDPGPRHDERLTANPLHHIDLVGGLLAVLFSVGWVKPIAVDPDRMRIGRAGLPVVVVVASCGTLALGILLGVIRPVVLNMLPDTGSAIFFVFVTTVGRICLSFTLFNLLPLPPLTGQLLLLAIVPRQSVALRRAQPYIAALLAVLIMTGEVGWLLVPIEAAVARLIPIE